MTDLNRELQEVATEPVLQALRNHLDKVVDKVGPLGVSIIDGGRVEVDGAFALDRAMILERAMELDQVLFHLCRLIPDREKRMALVETMNYRANRRRLEAKFERILEGASFSSLPSCEKCGSNPVPVPGVRHPFFPIKDLWRCVTCPDRWFEVEYSSYNGEPYASRALPKDHSTLCEAMTLADREVEKKRKEEMLRRFRNLEFE